jgi:hypothetical protein
MRSKRIVKLIKLTVFISLIFIFIFSENTAYNSLNAQNVLFDFYIPWDDAADSAINLRSLSDAPAGRQGFVTVSADGHLATATGRIRFWGVNTCFGANFPEKKDAPKIASHLAKYGVNIVRFHHMDMMQSPDGIWASVNPDRVLDAGQLDRLDFFIAELKKNGIYADLNLLVSRPFARGPELAKDIDSVREWKTRAALGFFDAAIVDLQKKYARDLLTHQNPYTGNAYAQEPAVALIEINNENGLAQTYLSGNIDTLPQYYKKELETLWNAWLSKRYNNNASLVAAWKVVTVKRGDEILSNGDFSAGTLSSWNVENYEGALSAQSITVDGPDHSPALRLEIKKTGTAAWHAQFNQGGLNLEANVPYTLVFFARADGPREMSVEIGMAHDPWQNLGFQSRLKLTKEWQRFEFPPIMLRIADVNARVNFTGFGLSPQTIWVSGVSLRKGGGGTAGLLGNENLDSRNIGLFAAQGSNVRPPEALADWYAFLVEQEAVYWKEMYDFIKTDLKAKALVVGTIVGTSTPSVMAELDAIDGHAYWDHLVFPNREWDPVDWYVKNTAMVNHPETSTLASLFVKRVKGKPFFVTEYNHPFPNTFGAEGFLLLAAYAGLQDWDLLIPFAYSGRRSDWDARKIAGSFEIDQNPFQLASFIPAAAAFRRFDIKPAQEELVVGLDREKEALLLRSSFAWKLVDAQSVGLSPSAGFLHRVAIDVKNLGRGAPPALRNIIPTRLESDTKELLWNTTEKGRGVFTVNSERTKMLVGFSGGKRYDLGNIVIEPGTTLQKGFSVITVSVIEGNTFRNAKRLLVTALGSGENTGMTWYSYPSIKIEFPPAEGEKVTLKDNYGRAPSRVEGIAATLTFQSPSARVRAWALDNTGKRVKEIGVSMTSTGSSIAIGPEYRALWYEVTIGE